MTKREKKAFWRDFYRYIAQSSGNWGGGLMVEGKSEMVLLGHVDHILEHQGHELGLGGYRLLIMPVDAQGKSNTTKIAEAFVGEGVQFCVVVDHDAKKEYDQLEEVAFRWGEETKDLEGLFGVVKIEGSLRLYMPPRNEVEALLRDPHSKIQPIIQFLREKGAISLAFPGFSTALPIVVDNSDDGGEAAPILIDDD
uniref:Uncharacterized protein n=1 Tax=Chromera velia CCMP2878 TaxID=1169474 RepID=A0A0K6S9M6_9ALVE|eukprot:Cvel_31009.t1-p1 / transcript=Cvel_31009.t1 / gene=Cvel_31009 / organism=Chromera_velia_CCMP2878 / gene_product=hypothetical protein / transcript_product=hypothetical protein / location=Cvel_scaffold4537:5382-5966(-) / protein_length=195 / sequence_SO=supercontig / SO=protein_coding / is_pseudo=false